MKYFKLFTCCRLVKGANRSVIMDLQRGSFETVPNDLYNLLIELRTFSYDDIILKFDKNDQVIINDYMSFLIKNEYGFWCTSKKEFDCFPESDDTFEFPYIISNIIIDIGNDLELDYKDIIQQVNEINIPYVQLRSTFDNELIFYENLLKSILKSQIISVQLIIPYPKNKIDDNTLKLFVRRNLRLNSIIFHSSPFNKNIRVLDNLTNIVYTKRTFNSVLDCGNISFKYFICNQNFYLESLKYNTCLNRKISIDQFGEIRNCPAMSESYGNIRNTKLSSIIKTNISPYWTINKDQINVCKDCEFRYVCMDCRAIVKDSTNIFSQPSKCNYNPYISKWKGERGFKSINKWRKIINNEVS